MMKLLPKIMEEASKKADIDRIVSALKLMVRDQDIKQREKNMICEVLKVT